MSSDDTIDVDDDNVVQMNAPEADDVSVADWLSGSDVNEMVDYFYLKNGKRLRLMAIADKEENAIRMSSTKVNPKNPQGSRQLDLTKYRRNMIAAAVNKGQNLPYNAVGDKAVTGDALASRPVGELTQMLEKIMEISGMPVQSKVGNQAGDAISFFD